MISSLRTFIGIRGASAIHPVCEDSRRDADDLEAASSSNSSQTQQPAAFGAAHGVPVGTAMLARRRTVSAGGSGTARSGSTWHSEPRAPDTTAPVPASTTSFHGGASASSSAGGADANASGSTPTMRRVSMRVPEIEAASFHQAIAAYEVAELGGGSRPSQKLASAGLKRSSFNSHSAVPAVASDTSQPDQASARSIPSSHAESEQQGSPSSSGHPSTGVSASSAQLHGRATPAPPPTQRANKAVRPFSSVWATTPAPPTRTTMQPPTIQPPPPPISPSPAQPQQTQQLPPRHTLNTPASSARAGPMWGGPLVRMDTLTGGPSTVTRSAHSFTSTSMARPHGQPRQPPRFEVVPYSELRFIQQIGEGGFGKVYYGHFRGSPCAIKVASVQPGCEASSSLVTEFTREVTTMSSIPPCPHILRLIAACTEPPNLALVTDYCARGSLYSLLHNPSAAAMPLKQLLSIWLGVARGMAHLHACSPPVLHRDLKSANLLLDDVGGVRIADFGLSRMYADVQALTGGLGTYQWMAPEVLAHQKYSTRADVYSFGIVMWECLTRALPYQGMTAVQAAVGVVNQGLRPDIPQDTPPELASLIRACWAPVPDQRPTFDSVVQVLVGMLGPEFVGQDGKDSQAVECPPDRKSAPGRVGGGSAQQRA